MSQYRDRMQDFRQDDDYELQFADGVEIDKKLLEGFKAKARDLGLSRDEAQELADFYAVQIGEDSKAHSDFLDATQKQWEEEIRARPGFKQEIGAAQAVLKEFGSPELAPLLRQSMLGSNPVFFDFMVEVSKALPKSAKKSAANAPGNGESLADRLWPDM